MWEAVLCPTGSAPCLHPTDMGISSHGCARYCVSDVSSSELLMTSKSFPPSSQIPFLSNTVHGYGIFLLPHSTQGLEPTVF